MMLSGIVTKAKRSPEKGGTPGWVDVDIVELSDTEFLSWWEQTPSDKDKFVVAQALRNLCVHRSDWGEGMAP